MNPIPAALRLSDRITLVPVVHGSGDVAVAVRQLMLDYPFDCLAVPLPPSSQAAVESGLESLPAVTLALQHPASGVPWGETYEAEASRVQGVNPSAWPYVPLDPCQPVIAALRFAVGEHLPRWYIDKECEEYIPHATLLPDPYALKRVALGRFAAAVLPALARPTDPRILGRLRHMAGRLKDLERRHQAILGIVSIVDWPWIREAYHECTPVCPEVDAPGEVVRYRPAPATLTFLLGELPFITDLYERARRQWTDDTNLSLDGVKELLLAARTAYRREFRRRARPITPSALALCLKYVRNLTLLHRRLTPDLYSLVVAAKQVLGDSFALSLVEQARTYPHAEGADYPEVLLGIDRARLPHGVVVPLVSRLPGLPREWRSVELTRRPTRREYRQWQMRWNPFAQCSWPPEDERIENFRTHVTDRARAILGQDLARSEKFSSSLKDGLDIRETLRNWHTGELYVKILPPARGPLDAVVMLFDSPADPRDYPWRTTWFAEHPQESTLAFFATDYREELVGPGIGLATYGGALFLFPPVSIPDVWRDRRLDFSETLEERLLAAACLHSRSPHVVLVSPGPPGAGWRRLARRYRKRWIHLPTTSFSQSTLAQLKLVHVLNGRTVRSFAADFIRRA